MGKFRHFYDEIVEVPLSFLNHIFFIFFNKILARNWRYKTAWPSLHHCHPHLIKFIEPSADVDLTVFILSFDDVDSIFSEGGSPKISTNDPKFYSRLFFIFHLKADIGILAILLMIKFALIIWCHNLLILFLEWFFIFVFLYFFLRNVLVRFFHFDLPFFRHLFNRLLYNIITSIINYLDIALINCNFCYWACLLILYKWTDARVTKNVSWNLQKRRIFCLSTTYGTFSLFFLLQWCPYFC